MHQAEKAAPPQLLSTHPSVSLVDGMFFSV